MYINIGANKGSEKLWTNKQTNAATSGKPIKAVYASYVYVCIFVQVSRVG